MVDAQNAAPTCEYLLGTDPLRFCGKLAVRRYPASGGGFMHLCIEHGKPHEKYSEKFYEGERDA